MRHPYTRRLAYDKVSLIRGRDFFLIFFRENFPLVMLSLNHTFFLSFLKDKLSFREHPKLKRGVKVQVKGI